MGQVTIHVNGSSYLVGCRDGEEAHLHALGQKIDERVARLRSTLSPPTDAYALLLAALVMADEIHDLTRGRLTEESRAVLQQAEKTIKDRKHEAERLNQAAELAESLAERVASSDRSRK